MSVAPVTRWALVLLTACARNVDAIAAHDHVLPAVEAEPLRGECHIDGDARPDASASLFGDRDDPTRFAHFNGRPVSLAVHDVPGMIVDRVGLRAMNRGGFALDGWIDRGKLAFAARERIPLAGDVAWIPRGTALTVKLGEGRKVVVAPTTKTLMPVDAAVPCSTVAIGAVEPERPLAEVGELFALASDRLPLSATRDTPPVFTLRFKPGASVYVMAEDTGDGVRVRFTDGIAVDGWVDKSALKPLTSLGMSGCSCGGVGHGFGMMFPPGGVRLATPVKKTRVSVGEKAPGVVRGSVAKGAELIVLAEVGAYARVLPRCRELLPETAFWVAREDLVHGPMISNAAMLDVGCR